MAERANTLREMFEAVSLGAPENAVGFVLWRVFARYQREIDRALAGLDLTNLQFVTLALAGWLGRAGEPVEQGAMARFGGIHPMQLSQMLKTLESKGLLVRGQSLRDSRAKQVEITAAGVAALRRALPLAIGVQREIFGAEGQPGGGLLEALLKLDVRNAGGDQAGRG